MCGFAAIGKPSINIVSFLEIPKKSCAFELRYAFYCICILAVEYNEA
jgi:hypothetical protein